VKVIVTGATGFIASHLVPALAADGYAVVAAGHDFDRIPFGDGVQRLELDLRADLGGLPGVDAIVHLAQANAAFPEGAADLFAVNTASTVTLLDHARRCGARRFVFASSASVYGLGETPFREDDPLVARDFYAATKVAAERFVDAYSGGFSTTTLRLVAPYGPRLHGRLIAALATRVRDRSPITLNDGGRPRTNPVYVDDVVSVVRRALDADASRVLNVAGDDIVSIEELARVIGDALGIEPIFEAGDQQVAGDLVADNRRLREFLGEPLVPIAEGVRRMVNAEAVA